jgi:hypothetical protein
MDLGELMNKLGQMWPARLAKDAAAAAMYPGEVYASDKPVTTEEMIQPAANMAGFVASGAAPFAERGAIGIFGGRLAKTADLGALSKAEAMEKAGATPAEIWDRDRLGVTSLIV